MWFSLVWKQNVHIYPVGCRQRCGWLSSPGPDIHMSSMMLIHQHSEVGETHWQECCTKLWLVSWDLRLESTGSYLPLPIPGPTLQNSIWTRKTSWGVYSAGWLVSKWQRRQDWLRVPDRSVVTRSTPGTTICSHTLWPNTPKPPTQLQVYGVVFGTGQEGILQGALLEVRWTGLEMHMGFVEMSPWGIVAGRRVLPTECQSLC